MKRAFIYTRVSTDEQAEYGNGLDIQLEHCQQYAMRNEFEIVETFADGDVSGKIYLPERPRGGEMHTRVLKGEANAVIIDRVDRMGREELDLRLVAREWLRNSIELHFTDIGQVTDASSIVFVVTSWKGHEEHRTIVTNMCLGRERKARSGRVVGGGKPPYGYKYEYEILPSGKNRVKGLAKYEPEAVIVRRIFQLYANGATLRGIAARMNAEHAPLPGATRPCGKPRLRDSRPGWTPQTIRRILQSETYCGLWTFNKSKRKNAKNQSEQIKVVVPAIISRELYEQAAARFEYNTTFARRNQKRAFLLSGLTRCACGYALRGATQADRRGNPTRYYRCGQTPKNCGALRTRADTLEAVAWQFILDVFKDEEEYKQQLERAAARQEDERAPKRAERQTLLEEMATTEAHANQIAAAFSLVKQGGIVESNFKAQAAKVDKQYMEQQKRLARIEAELSATALTQGKVDNLLEFRRNVVLGIENPTDDLKTKTFRDLEIMVTRWGEIVHVTSLIGECEYRLLNGREFVSHSS